ncbi:MAG: RsmG family class I SAM-dependent methyltransferase [Sandaracinus sp.]
MSERERAIERVVRALCPEASEHLPALSTFVGLVETWNAKLDLTGARDARALADVMIADALVLADPAFVAPGARLLDVGSGAGGPALPLAIVRPDVPVTMLEPLQKRVAFLRTAIGTLRLAPRVTALAGRVELASPTAPVAADVTSARATFAPTDWLAAGLALAPSVLVLTTPQELPAGAAPAARRDYEWPGSGAPRVLLRFDRSA